MFRFIPLYLGLFASCCLGASFDCSKASHPVEKAVCSNPVLSKLDDTLSSIYKQTLKKMRTKADTDRIKEEQRYWLKFVRTKFSSTVDPDSLIKTYSNRIEDFRLKLKYINSNRFTGGLLLQPTVCMAPSAGDFEPEDACNTISITFKNNNAIDFTINTTGNYCSRSCEASGIAKRNNKDDYVFHDSGDEECTLTIVIGKKSITVTADDCNDFCGAGASLDFDVPFLNIIAHDFR